MKMKTLFMAFIIITALVSYAYPSSYQKDVNDKPLVNPGHQMEALRDISPAAQDYNFNIIENMSPKYIAYLKTCTYKMGPRDIGKCNENILKEILTNELVSRDCCLKIVRAGKECYMEFRKFMFQLYQLKRFASQVSSRTNKVWNRCSVEVESPSSS